MSDQLPTKRFRAKTVGEFISDWHIGRTTFYGLVKAGKLRVTKIGKATRILPEDEIEFAEELKRSTKK